MGKPIRYAVNLISEAKRGVMGDEHRTSVIDFIEVNGRPGFYIDGTYVVSDMSRLRFDNIDFGWGPALFGGVARAGTGPAPGMLTPLVGYKDEEGIEGVLALVSLPLESVDRFRMEVRKEIDSTTWLKPRSAL